MEPARRRAASEEQTARDDRAGQCEIARAFALTVLSFFGKYVNEALAVHETIDVDVVIVALGTTPNPLIAQTTKGLETTKWGTVVVTDENTGKTVKPGVWAGGDVVTGAATVISAMGAGKKAAADIDAYLRG